MKETIIVLAVVATFMVIVAALNWSTWFPKDNGSAFQPSYSFPGIAQRDDAGVYIRDGQPRYMLRGEDVTADAFKRARSPQEWEQAQAWIREQRPVVR